MSILKDHFERKAAAASKGRQVIPGLYMDVIDTLSDGYYVPNAPLLDFARWNNVHRLLGKNHIFSSDIFGAAYHLHRSAIDLFSLGAYRIKSKSQVYQNLQKENALQPPGHASCIEMVIDDLSPTKTGAKNADDVLTWLDPHDEAVQLFLREKRYLDFQP